MRSTANRVRRFGTFFTMVAVGLLFVASCGGKGGGSSSSSVDLFKQGKGAFLGVDIRPSPKTPGEPDAGLTPVRGGTVTYGLEAEDEGGYCLPEAQADISGEQIIRSVYDTLTAPGADGQYHPFLASKVTHSDDYKTWTITPRAGVKFSDGTPLTAQVIKDNLDAYRGALPARHPLLFIFTFKNIATTAVQGNDVVVTMHQPWVRFDAALFGQARVGIMGEKQLNADPSSCAKDLVGTGPFILQQWVPNDHYTMVRNPNYWLKDANGQQLPYLDKIIYKPIPDGPTRLSNLEAGSINAMHTSSGASIQKLRSDADAGKVNMITSVHDTEIGHFMFNTAKAPFNDLETRQAVSMAINREKANELVGDGVPPLGQSAFPPGQKGYHDTGYPKYDPAAAKALVAKLKQEGKPTSFQISATPDSETVRTAQLAQADLQKVGFKVTITTLEQAKLINNAISGDFQMVTWRNYGGTNPDNQYVWWYGNGNPVNFARYNDPVINCLLDVGRSAMDVTGCLKPGSDAVKADPKIANIDPKDENAVYGAINDRFATQAYYVWGAYSPWTIATATNVHGILGPPLPDGTKPWYGLLNGDSPAGLWVSK
ncbi:MAG TPA: ABC transporter substrate-binding protein [Acidimicrobiales bacterium]|jgi:peptide/nickel transport system substrate-binding protein|nr:ABC transporter substrate-binding protein [Acidimicrobiales bacterium]